MLLLDVDFLVSVGVTEPAAYPAILEATRRGEALVLPAFETIEYVKDKTRAKFDFRKALIARGSAEGGFWSAP